jgi:uncharacterized OB-fold protein
MPAELLTGTPPALLGSECSVCGTVAFPAQAACPRCTSTDVVERALARRGTLWSWTVQRFRPKSPPYAGPEEFEPYGVGYVELPGEVRVEARLTLSTGLRIGMEMELTMISEAAFAFRPV